MNKLVGGMMVVRNEALRIKECLEWHLPYLDQIVICDQESSDDTVEIAKKVLIKWGGDWQIITDKQWGFCEPSKQKTADLLITDWIFYFDADEKFNKEFLGNMKQSLLRDNYDGYTFKRDNIFVVKVYDDNVPIGPKFLRVKHPAHDYQLRLTRRSISMFPDMIHHRVRLQVENPKVAKISQSIEHVKSITEQWDDIKRYQIVNKK